MAKIENVGLGVEGYEVGFCVQGLGFGDGDLPLHQLLGVLGFTRLWVELHTLLRLKGVAYTTPHTQSGLIGTAYTSGARRMWKFQVSFPF